MLERLKRLFGLKVEEKSIEEKLWGGIFMPRDKRDIFRLR